jgi:hypothetical protein
VAARYGCVRGDFFEGCETALRGPSRTVGRGRTSSEGLQRSRTQGANAANPVRLGLQHTRTIANWSKPSRWREPTWTERDWLVGTSWPKQAATSVGVDSAKDVGCGAHQSHERHRRQRTARFCAAGRAPSGALKTRRRPRGPLPVVHSNSHGSIAGRKTLRTRPATAKVERGAAKTKRAATARDGWNGPGNRKPTYGP